MGCYCGLWSRICRQAPSRSSSTADRTGFSPRWWCSSLMGSPRPVCKLPMTARPPLPPRRYALRRPSDRTPGTLKIDDLTACHRPARRCGARTPACRVDTRVDAWCFGAHRSAESLNPRGDPIPERASSVRDHKSDRQTLDRSRGCRAKPGYRGCFTAFRKRSDRRADLPVDRAGPTGGPESNHC
jgi:hypothetical protein